MRSLGGLILLLAGVGVTVFVYLPPPVDSATRFGPVIDEFNPVSRLAQFSPSIALPAPTPLGSRLAGLEITAAAVLRVASAQETQPNWQTTVASAATPSPTELTPHDADARNKLAENIQQQLRRVGCYWGRIDGSWNSITKDAMKEFTDRVNAILPLDQPDYVQLALIQSQSAEICGACPAGQSLSSSGRCVGIGQRVASTQNEVLPWMANAVPDTPVAVRLFKPLQTSPMPDRMALGAPVPISVDGQQPVRDFRARFHPAPGEAGSDGRTKGTAPLQQRQLWSESSPSRRRAITEYPQAPTPEGRNTAVQSAAQPRRRLLSTDRNTSASFDSWRFSVRVSLGTDCQAHLPPESMLFRPTSLGSSL
jgi:hypothetical protein